MVTPSDDVPEAVVRFALTASGAVADFDAAKKTAMEGAYATWAGVPKRRVRVTVVPASVLITVALEVVSMADATALQTRVNDINTPQAHEGILTSAGVTGVAVLAVSAATKGAVGATPEPPPGSGDAGDGGGSSSIGIIAGAAGGGIVILILVAVCMARK